MLLLKLNTIILDPLEQFEVFDVVCRFFSNIYVFELLVFFLILTFVWNGQILSTYNNIKSEADNWYFAHRSSFDFVFSLVKENLNIKTLVFFPVIYITFLYIFFANMIGMIPYSFTITSSFIIAFFLSSQFFIGVTLLGFQLHRYEFFSMFLPAGVPLVIAPGLVVIEFISYFARVLSLAIRLFANMMSGHSLLKILGGFVWAMISAGGVDSIIALFPVIVVFVVTGLETVIAFLQAYVFTILITIYINDVINTH